MKHPLVLRSLAFIAASSLAAACSGGGGGGAGSIPSANNPLTNSGGNSVPAALSNFTWGANVLKTAQLIGPATFKSMTVDVEVTPQNAQGLLAYAQSASNPHSPLYRHFLTPQQIGAQYGASQSNITAVAAYFEKYKLTVGTWPQHLLMVVGGTQANLQAAFGTQFGLYRSTTNQQEFIAPTSAPHFSQVVPVSAVGRIVHAAMSHTYFLRPGNGAEFVGMHPAQYQRAFDFTGAYNAGYNGTGINVGIIGTGGISSADVPAFSQLTGAKVATVTEVPVSDQPPTAQNNGTGSGAFGSGPSGFQTPPPVTDPNCTTGTSAEPAPGCNPEDGEAQLDTEQAASMAPGSSVLFYLAFNVDDCGGPCSNYGISGLQGIYETDDEIQQAIADNTADVISMSYGGGEPEEIGYYFDSSGAGIGPLEFAALATEGIAAFAASGDSGAYECSTTDANGNPIYVNQLCVSYPASDPSVVGVGGINAPLDNAGNLVSGQTFTAWGDNTTAGGDGIPDNSVGSGGGPSAVFVAPSWQGTITGAGGMRATPDISLEADPLTGPLLLMNEAFPDATSAYASGGTSAASPETAAAWAVVLSACKAISACSSKGTGPHPYRLGDPNPLFYSIYQANLTYAAPSPFYDIVAGSNGAIIDPNPTINAGFSAGPGYDMVTGIGVPFIGYLINATVEAQGGTSPNIP